MTSQFTYQSDPIRIVFGAGSVAALRAEADFHKISRLIVLCSPSRTDMARRATASVADRCTGLCDASAPNMPREAFDRVIAEIERHKVDGFVVIGGGSPIGLAKAAAVATKLPYIAIVTTYSGSEMAPRWRIGIADKQVSGDDRAALPATAIYDPELALDLPVRMTAASGMNAMAHAVESLYGPDTNPVVQTMAEEAVRRIGSSLPRVVESAAISRRARISPTAPGSRRISAPKSGSSTPSPSACGSGSISTMPTPTRSPHPTP